MYTYMCLYVCMRDMCDECMCVHVRTCVRAYMYVHACACVYMCECMCVRVCACVCVCDKCDELLAEIIYREMQCHPGKVHTYVAHSPPCFLVS